METAFQIIVAVFCLPLLALGIKSMFTPEGMGKEMSISPKGAAGLNTIRAVIGGLFFACVAMLIVGLVTQQTTWFLAVAIIMVAVAFGRVVGILADGLDKAVIPPLVVELVLIGGLVAAHVVLPVA